MRGLVSTSPYRAAVACALAVSGPEHDGSVAAVSQSVDLGRVRGFNLCNGLGALLVRRIDSRFCDVARPGQAKSGKGHLRDVGDGLARLGQTLASLRDGVSVVGGIGDAACRIGSHGGEL